MINMVDISIYASQLFSKHITDLSLSVIVFVSLIVRSFSFYRYQYKAIMEYLKASCCIPLAWLGE